MRIRRFTPCLAIILIASSVDGQGAQESAAGQGETFTGQAVPDFFAWDAFLKHSDRVYARGFHSYRRYTHVKIDLNNCDCSREAVHAAEQFIAEYSIAFTLERRQILSALTSSRIAVRDGVKEESDHNASELALIREWVELTSSTKHALSEAIVRIEDVGPVLWNIVEDYVLKDVKAGLTVTTDTDNPQDRAVWNIITRTFQ